MTDGVLQRCERFTRRISVNARSDANVIARPLDGRTTGSPVKPGRFIRLIGCMH